MNTEFIFIIINFKRYKRLIFRTFFKAFSSLKKSRQVKFTGQSWPITLQYNVLYLPNNAYFVYCFLKSLFKKISFQQPNFFHFSTKVYKPRLKIEVVSFDVVKNLPSFVKCLPFFGLKSIASQHRRERTESIFCLSMFCFVSSCLEDFTALNLLLRSSLWVKHKLVKLY